MKLVNLDIKQLAENDVGFGRTFKLSGISEDIIDSEGLTFHFRCSFNKDGRRYDENWDITYTDLTFESAQEDELKTQFEGESHLSFTTNAPIGNRYFYTKYYE